MKKPHFETNGIDKNRTAQFQAKGQKSTTLALSLASCLFMGAIGYGVTRENSLIAASPSMSSVGLESKSSVIARPSSGITLAAADIFLSDDDDNYEIKQLKDHNARQATKIRALRQELIEKMQDLHALKSRPF